MDQELLKQLQPLAERYLGKRGGSVTRPLAAGGSAAVYIAQVVDRTFALKVYDPTLLEGRNGPAERRRIELQRRLIGHPCRTLVQLEAVVVNESGCFVEMEYVPWDTLKKVIPQVPDAVVPQLLAQLVDAARFLDELGIVHRDIKPENILVSSDFSEVRLIDLGVAREATTSEEASDATDHGHRRPFVATAQYSSPEYLFRLEVPSAEMWRALTFYQIGGVLHDLLVKRALFAEAARTENKHIISMAVFRDTPDLSTAAVEHASLALLAAHCLVKDPNVRLRLVSWDRFVSPALNGAEKLRAVGAQLRAVAQARREVEQQERTTQTKRERLVKDLEAQVKQELLQLVSGAFKITSYTKGAEAVRLQLSDARGLTLNLTLLFSWGMYPLPTRALVSLVGMTDAEPDPALTKHATIAEVDTEVEVSTLCAAAIDRLGVVIEHAVARREVGGQAQESKNVDLVAMTPLQ